MSGNHGPWDGRVLKRALSRLQSKQSRLRRFFRLSGNREHFLDLDIEFTDYDAVVLLFREIFVHGDYYFTAGTESPFILDCGSNIGLASLYFKRLYPRAQIVAFEPDPVTFQVLRKNLDRNGARDVQTVNRALYGESVRLPFYRDSKRTGALYAGAHPGLVEMVAGRQRVTQGEVEAVRLSDYIDQSVDFLKLDVEGCETSVILDLATTGKLRMVRKLVMEYHHQIPSGQASFGAILRALEQNGLGYHVSAQLPQTVHQPAYQNVLVYAYQEPATTTVNNTPC